MEVVEGPVKKTQTKHLISTGCCFMLSCQWRWYFSSVWAVPTSQLWERIFLKHLKGLIISRSWQFSVASMLPLISLLHSRKLWSRWEARWGAIMQSGLPAWGGNAAVLLKMCCVHPAHLRMKLVVSWVVVCRLCWGRKIPFLREVFFSVRFTWMCFEMLQLQQSLCFCLLQHCSSPLGSFLCFFFFFLN